MNTRAERNLILSAKELYVALIASGCKKIRAVVPQCELSKRDVPEVMSSLAQRNFIRSDGERFEAVGDFSDAVRLLAFAPDFYVLRSRKPVLPDLCCFGNGTSFALCEIMSTKKGYVRICLCDFVTLFSKLWCEGYFEGFSDGCSVSEDELKEYEQENLEPKNVFAEKNEGSRRIFSFNLVSDNTTERYVDLVEYYLCTYILEYDGNGEIRRTIYTKEDMCEALRRLVQQNYDNY